MADDLRTDLAVRETGLPEGSPTLVLVHGLTDAGDGWPGAEAHWRGAHRIIAFDQRGHGRSPRFTAEQREGHPGDVLVDDLVGLLEQLPSPPVVVGHSVGGAVALAVAVRRPELVRALVLEDPAVLGPEDEQRSAARGRDLLEGLAESRSATDDASLQALRKARHPDWPEDELLVTGRAEQLMDTDFLALGDYQPSPRWPELLAALRTPTLLVTGDGEVVVGAEVESLLTSAANPHLRLERVAGAGHCVRREQPEAFYALVDAFLGAAAQEAAMPSTP